MFSSKPLLSNWKKIKQKQGLVFVSFNGIDTIGMLPKSVFCTKLGVIAHKIDDRIKNKA